MNDEHQISVGTMHLKPAVKIYY